MRIEPLLEESSSSSIRTKSERLNDRTGEWTNINADTLHVICSTGKLPEDSH